MTKKKEAGGGVPVDIAKIAHQFGGFYETGAWRFPSPDRMQSFEIALEAAEEAANKANTATGDQHV